MTDDEELTTLQFGPRIRITLPKNDVPGAWSKLKKYMELYFQFEQEDAVRRKGGE